VLGSGSEDARYSVDLITWLRSGLRAVDLIEGKDYVLQSRWAQGDYTRFPRLAAELIATRPSAIVVSTIAAAEAAREVSNTLPIVMTALNDPVGAGLAASLARPAGNITGIATMNEDVIVKLLGLSRSALPKATHLAVILNPKNPSNPVLLATLKAEISRLGFATQVLEVSTPGALDNALEQLDRQHSDLLLLIPDNSLHTLSDRIVSRALAKGVPTVATSQEAFFAGALLTYGLILREAVERVGFFLKKILAGVPPADLPIEQPAKFHLALNVKIAKELGIEFPESLLAQADEVIE
jgi:putative tryptophan/tyrosine transport system substrate-binding protein